MNRKEYLTKRNSLYDEAQAFINNGKLEEAQKKMKAIEELDNNFEKTSKLQANLDALNGKGVNVPEMYDSAILETGNKNQTAADIYSSEEYCNAFMNYVLKGAPIDNKFNNSTTTSTTAPALVPTVTYQKIIMKLEKVGSIYARVFKTAFPAGLVIPAASVKPAATWNNEDQGSTAQNISIKTITFKGYKLDIRIAFSLYMTVTAYEVFEAQFIEIVTEAIVKALEKAIIAGLGESGNQPTGILKQNPTATIKIAKADKLTYNTLTSAEEALPSGYDATTVWLMTKKTFFKFIGMTDTAGQPIARVNAGFDGKPNYTLIGREVVFADDYMDSYADTVAKDTIFAAMFDLNSYILNEVQGLTIKRYTDEDNDNTVLKATMIVDGQPVDTNSLVKLIKTVA